MYNFTDHCWLTSIAKVVLRTFQLKFTLFLHQYIVMENKFSVIIDQWTKQKLMKNNLPASSPNRVSNIPTNANISIAVHKDLSGHVAGFLAFTFLDVPFHCERCRQVLIVYRRKASNVYGVSNKKLQFWKSFKFCCYPSILMFFLLSNKSHHWNYTSTGILLGTKKINWKI